MTTEPQNFTSYPWPKVKNMKTNIRNKFYETPQVYFEKNQMLKYSVLGWDVSKHLIIGQNNFWHIDILSYCLVAIT